MSKKELTLDDLLKDERMKNVTEYAARYGVSAAVIDYGAHSDLAAGGYYIVAGLGSFPDITARGMSPKALERQAARNKNLFYPKAFAREVTADNIDTVIDGLNLYCQQAEIISALYREHGCKVPDVMCYAEMRNLISFNDSAANQKYDFVLRGEYSRLIDRFFENEAKIQKGRRHRELMEYVRSDRYDGPLNRFRKDLAYYRLKGKQEIPLPLLQETFAEIVKGYFDESEYQNIKQILAYTPYVFYSAGPVERHDYGRIEGPHDPWKGEKRYFELRPVYYKKIDEPEVASAYIRTKFVAAPTRDCVARGLRESAPGKERPVARYVPYRAMDAFIQIAKENNLEYTFDYDGILLTPSFKKIPVIVAAKDAKLLGSILTSIDDHGFQEHWIHESNLPYLSSSPTREELIRSASGWAARIPECPVDSTRQRREEASA